MGLMHMLGWYLERCRTERRKYRKMMYYHRPHTWRMAAVLLVLLAAIGLWVLFPPPALADAGALYVITASPYANIREAPNTRSIDLGDARQGDMVRGIYADGWVLATREQLMDGTEISLSVEPGRGYIRADLLTLADPDYPVGRYANATGGRVRIRKTPDGETVAWLKAGGTVDVLRWVAMEGAPWAVTGKGYISGACLVVEP